MSAGMNMIFRGNGKRKAEREQEEAAPAEEVFSSQATRCAKREIDTEKKRAREGERGRGREPGSERGCSSCKVRRESAQ